MAIIPLNRLFRLKDCLAAVSWPAASCLDKRTQFRVSIPCCGRLPSVLLDSCPFRVTTGERYGTGVQASYFAKWREHSLQGAPVTGHHQLLCLHEGKQATEHEPERSGGESESCPEATASTHHQVPPSIYPSRGRLHRSRLLSPRLNKRSLAVTEEATSVEADPGMVRPSTGCTWLHSHAR